MLASILTRPGPFGAGRYPSAGFASPRTKGGAFTVDFVRFLTKPPAVRQARPRGRIPALAAGAQPPSRARDRARPRSGQPGGHRPRHRPGAVDGVEPDRRA